MVSKLRRVISSAAIDGGSRYRKWKYVMEIRTDIVARLDSWLRQETISIAASEINSFGSRSQSRSEVGR